MNVNIVGAGITGLSAAYFLSKEGHKVRVFDSAPEIGGLSGFFPVEGTYLEKYYHHVFSGHTGLIDLMKELNMEDDIFFRRVKMGFYHGGEIHPFATAKDLLSFTPLKIRDRIRLGLSSLLMMRIKDWKTMEKNSALDWLRTYSGKESCRIIWEPLLKMKFGDNYDCISAAWLWNRVIDRKKSKEKGGRKEVLGYIKNGYKKIFDALSNEIEKNGGIIYTGMPVKKILIEHGKSSGVITKDSFYHSDIVIATVAIPYLIEMASALPKGYIESLDSIRYQGSICVILELKKALSDYYWINVSDTGSPFVGIIEHTNLVPPEDYRGRHFVYLTRYSSTEDEIFAKSNEEIYRSFLESVKKIFPAFKTEEIEQYWVFRDHYSQPVFVQNYSSMMPTTSTPAENLYVLNTTQLYPESRCLNSSIVKARSVVHEIIHRNE
jgi:protoporphyrinogen oxidase